MSSYEKIQILKRMHYIPYWLIVGLVWFLVSEVLLRILGTPLYAEARLIASVGGISGLVIATIFISHTFKMTLSSLEGEIEIQEDYKKWMGRKFREIFTFDSPIAKLIVFIICIISTVIATSQGVHFNKAISNFVALIFLQPIFIVCGFGVYFLAHLLVFLSRLVRVDFNIPFYKVITPALSNISSFYYRTSLIVLLAYGWLLFVVWRSPYNFYPPIITTLTIIGFYPMIMFVWSYLQTHEIARRIKQKHIDAISKVVMEVFNLLNKYPTKENAEFLSQMMELQNKVEKLRLSQIDIEGRITLIVTAIIPMVQTVFLIIGAIRS